MREFIEFVVTPIPEVWCALVFLAIVVGVISCEEPRVEEVVEKLGGAFVSLCLGWVVTKVVIGFVVAFGGWSLVSAIMIVGFAWYGAARVTGRLPEWAQEMSESLGV